MVFTWTFHFLGNVAHSPGSNHIWLVAAATLYFPVNQSLISDSAISSNHLIFISLTLFYPLNKKITSHFPECLQYDLIQNTQSQKRGEDKPSSLGRSPEPPQGLSEMALSLGGQ